MTCDPSRPCQRCIQRGLLATCEDAPRKIKKYLSDVPTSLIHLNRQSPGPEDSGPPSTVASDLNQPQMNQNQVFQATMFQHSALLPVYSVHKPSHLARTTTISGVKPDPVSTMFPQKPYEVDGKYYTQTIGNNQESQHNSNKMEQGLSKGRKRTNFLSSAADLEYTTLSGILQDNSLYLNPNHLATSTEGTPNSLNLSPALSPHGISGLHKVTSPTSLSQSFSAGQAGENDFQMGYKTEFRETPNSLRCDGRINQYFLGANSSSNQNTYYPDVITAIETMKDSDPAAYYVQNSELALSFTIGISLAEQAGVVNDDNLQFKEPEEIYAEVSHPFSYTPGFHKLIAYLRKRFPKDMLVKMAESMAVYRPSFIACTNSLREADLIFMEQCFQRTLLTYDTFLKVSGTPTIVWRRTGEIAYVGSEFTLLTGWTQDQLMGDKPMFIVEVLDDKSVVEYFELFSKIAFGDFLGATMTECTLLTPKKDVKIRAGCIWTLKRDVFGIPMMIIGNFLPIL